MTRAESLDQGRTSLRQRAWGAAFAQLSAADREAPLDPSDLEQLSMAANLLGRESESSELLARAHNGFLRAGETLRAARCAFWLGFGLLFRGEAAQGSGWIARARRLVDAEGDCAERGYLLLPGAVRGVHEGDFASAYSTFAEAAAIGERFGETDLTAFARHGQGRALVRSGEIARGVALLDEVMVAVVADEVSPIIAGILYCSVIEVCHDIFDLRRAQEWTAALSQWCAAQPELMNYRGHCLVRRAEILQLRGDWADALDEAERARDRLSQPTVQPAASAAFYRVAELHRLRGDFAQAEAAYGQTSQWGRTPQPGLAQLRLIQGQFALACAAIKREAEETRDLSVRSRLLPAFVEIMLAAGDVAAARAAAGELCDIARTLDAPFLYAASACAMGAVLLAEGDARAALPELRRAWTAWCDLDAPYEAARVRVLLAQVSRALGDHDSAKLELDAAHRAFEQLGAAPDIARLEELRGEGAPAAAGPLTARELEVLLVVASGKTNREIAETLGISERTVARHVANIFLKLDVSTRAAATAYAYREKLVAAPT